MPKKKASNTPEQITGGFFDSMFKPISESISSFFDSITDADDEPGAQEPETVIKRQKDFLLLSLVKKNVDSVKKAAENLAKSLDALKNPVFYLENNANGLGITIADGQSLVVCSGSTAKECTVGKGGVLIIRDGAIGEDITLAKGAKLIVRKGGKALNVVNVGGEIDAEAGAASFAEAFPVKKTVKKASAGKKSVGKAEAKKASAEKKSVGKAKAKKASAEKKSVGKAEAKKATKPNKKAKS